MYPVFQADELLRKSLHAIDSVYMHLGLRAAKIKAIDKPCTGCPRMFYTLGVFGHNFDAHKNTITIFRYVY